VTAELLMTDRSNAEDIMSQEQSQRQKQAVNHNLNLNNSGDPQFEMHVFNELHSAGRQLSRVSSALEVVLKALDGHAALQQPDAWSAIEAFKQVQHDIARAKEEHRLEQMIILELSELSERDPAEHARVVAALNTYLTAANVQR
jgi:hypothetical protein